MTNKEDKIDTDQPDKGASGVGEESHTALPSPIEEVEPPRIVYRSPDSIDANARAAASTPEAGSRQRNY